MTSLTKNWFIECNISLLLILLKASFKWYFMHCCWKQPQNIPNNLQISLYLKTIYFVFYAIVHPLHLTVSRQVRVMEGWRKMVKKIDEWKEWAERRRRERRRYCLCLCIVGERFIWVKNLILVKNSTNLVLTMCSESCNSLLNNTRRRDEKGRQKNTARRRERKRERAISLKQQWPTK